MKTSLSPFRSIKARATLFTLLIFVASLWSLSFYASRMLQGDLQRLTGEQQFTTAHFVAEQVNGQLSDRMAALEGVARRVQPEMLSNARALQSFLEQRPSFEMLFNGGHFITDAQGTALASLPISVGRVGVNYIDRDHVASALKDGKPYISKPVIGKLLKTPVFSMAVPIFNAHGQVIGTLVGVIDLSRPNFLDNITNSAYGQAGGYLLIDSKSRLIITATDTRRRMEVLVPGFNPLADRFILGFEGTGVAVNPMGVEVLASGHTIPTANWHIVVSLPTSEAFAPILDMQRRMLLVTLGLTLLAGFLTWWMLRRELSPLLSTVHALVRTDASGALAAPLPIVRQDEVGALVGGFNRLLGELQQREQALLGSELRLRQFFEKNASVMMILDPDSGKIEDANPTAAAYYGYSREQLQAMRISDINTMAPDLIAAEKQLAKQEERRYFLFQHRLVSGEVRDVEVYSSPIESEGRTVLFSIVHDITQRMYSEQALRQSEAKHRNLVENSHDIIYELDSQGVFTFVSSAWTQMLGHPLDQVVGQAFTAFVHPDDLATCQAALLAVFETGERKFDIRYRVKHLNGAWRWHSSNAVAVESSSGAVIGFEGNAKDITEQLQEIKHQQFRTHTLVLLAGENSLEQILQALVLGVQEMKPEAICSVLLLSADGKHLGQGVAPGLPDFYNAAIDGIEIGLGVGSCGSAAFTGERVVVEDIQTHAFWAPYKELAAQAGLAACWSQPIRGASGQMLGTFAIYHRQSHVPDADDIALIEQSANLASITIEKRRSAQALRVSEQRLALAVNGAHEGIWDLDLLSGELYHSPGMAHMLGYTETELPARRELWDDITDPADVTNFRHEMGRHFKNADYAFDVLVRLRHKDGRWLWMQSRGQATRDAHGRAVRFSGTQFDVTERKQLEDQVRQLAFFDALTGLPNRRMLDDRLGQTMAASKRSGLYGALMFLDLDNFKPLNDTHGHAVGDLLLIEVAQRLSACVREMDTVARLGGDEFVVMLGELGADKTQSTEQAAGVAEKIRASLAAPYQLVVAHPGDLVTTVEHHCSASIGVVVFVNHEANQTELMKWADAAMYHAKEMGRNGVRFFQGK